MAGPQDWGAVPADQPQSGPASWGAMPVEAQPTQQPAPEPQPDVPPSFLHRLATGLAIGDVADKSPAELRQKGYGDFDLEANTAQAFKNGLKNFAEAKTGIQRGAGILEAAASPLTALFQAIGGAGEKATGGLLTNESIQDALMLSDGALGNFSRMRGGAEQVIGSLPKDADFQTAAKVLDSAAAEQNTRDLWQERGIHPAEAVHDAQSDTFLRNDIAPPSFVAFHGSPHDFDAFDINRIGTGEGAQSYGHGLYFAENPDVAESYTTAGVRGDKPIEYQAREAIADYGSRDEAIRYLQKEVDTGNPYIGGVIPRQSVIDILKSDQPLRSNVYQVRINADPEHFLDWDKPLSEQPPAAKAALEQLHNETRNHPTAKAVQWIQDFLKTDPTVEKLLSVNRTYGSQERQADVLRQAGIPGIKYLDQGSRAAGEGSRNFVVFSHNDIEITHKNGVPLTPTEVPNVQGTPVPDGTPRSELAKTGEAHIDKILESPVTQRVIDKPVIDREHTVPYTAGGSVPLEDPTVFIDHRFPRSFTVDGVTFDPADPFVVHENVEQHTMEMLTRDNNKYQREEVLDRFGKSGTIVARQVPESATHSKGMFKAKLPEGSAGKYVAIVSSDNGEGGTLLASRKGFLSDTNNPALFDSAEDAVKAAHEALGSKPAGMSPEAAYKVAHFEFAEKAEGAWYAAHGIDQAKAEAAYAPYMAAIQHSPGQEKIARAAIRAGDRIFTGTVHSMAWANAADAGIDMSKLAPEDADGFLTSTGRYVGREEAAKIADAALQRTGETGRLETSKLTPGYYSERPIPPNLYKRPYPHDNPSAAQHEPIAEPKPTAAEIKQAKAILDSQEAGGALKAMGADVTRDMPSLAQQPPRPAGSLMTAAKAAADKLFDMGRDAQMLVAPMAARGPNEGRAIAKDFANAMRRNRWEWDRYDSDIAKRFTPEQRKRMWDAADEESVLRQEGQASEHMGLATLEPEERAAVEDLQARAQLAWARARDMGMVDGEGLPAYTPRMVINAASAVSGDKAIPLNGLGANLRTRTAQMMRRKYMIAEETEAAAKARLGDDAMIARDIRALPLATARLEDAIAGRTLIDNIKDIGRRTGAETVADGWQPDSSWFTLDHPAFRTFKPRLEEVDGVMRAAKDANGDTIFDQVPLYVRGDLEGPLRAVLNVRKGAQSYSGALYGGMMALKGKTMGLIMNSPLIHNMVEWGRALPGMLGKGAFGKIYFQGNRAKNDIATMKEAIDGGLVPIGKRFFNQDITSIMEEPNLTPGRSWTSQVLGFVPGLFDEGAGTAVKAAIDKAGDFWHNTMLWDRIADLQMGLYTNFRDEMLAKGTDRLTATRIAAHWANRYAGALPKEAMSDAATKISNMLFFSRSFTMGNLGVLKDMLTGLPKDVLAQIERDAGFGAGSIGNALPEGAAAGVQYAKTLARRKAMAVVALDMALFYVGNSVLQSALNVLKGDNTLEQEMHGYASRLHDALQKRAEHPLSLLQPFDFIQSLSSTAENEPGKQDRIKIGHAADGTAIYARSPAGKIGEEFVDWMTGPLDMMRRKLGTIARPAWQVYANDAGFGRKIYDPDADTPGKYLRNMGNIAEHIAGAQLPEGQINAFSDLVTGQGDPKVNAAQAFGPVAGVTFAKGAPGGEAVGELYNARTEHNYAVDAELPDIRRQVQRGDEQGARERMTQLGIPRGLQNFYVRTSQNPATRLTPRTLRDFYNYATPEQKARMENAR